MRSSAASATKSKPTTLLAEPFTPYAEPWKPHAGQKKGVKFLLEHGAAGIFADPGVGKTSIAYGAFKILKKQGLASKMLVIAPLKPCYLVWPKERDKWKDFNHFRVEVLHGPKKEEALNRDADIYIVNPDGLDWLLGCTRIKLPSGRVAVTVDLKRFKSFGFDVLCVDELSKFKHIQSGRFKALKQVIGTFGRRWGLTGSPAANGLMDLFGQCYILDMGRTFGAYITKFRSQYFVPSYDGFGYLMRHGAEKEIYDRLRPLVLRLAAEDYVDMPDVVLNKIKFKLPDKAQKIYDELEQDLVAKLDGGVVTASTAAVAMIKCRQVASGGLYLDGRLATMDDPSPKRERKWQHIHDEKTDLLEDLVEELQGTPLLVAYDFAHDLDRLRKRFGKLFRVIGAGSTSAADAETEKLWNQGKLPLLFGHPMSVGHGLNLQQAGNHVAWYSLTWDYELYDQFNRRVRRQGNKHQTVFIHHLMAEDTVDEDMYYALLHKQRGQNALFKALLERRRK